MSKKEELEISISNTGEVTINVIGAKGKSCIDMTKELEISSSSFFDILNHP